METLRLLGMLIFAGGIGLTISALGQSIAGRRAEPATEVVLDEGSDYMAVLPEELQLPPSERWLGPALKTARRLGRTLTPAWQMTRMRKHAVLAGLGASGVEGILALKAAGTAAGAIAFSLLAAMLGVGSGMLAVWAVVGGAIGFVVPDLMIARKGTERQLDIKRTLPETIDLMAIAVQAGMGLEASIELVSRKLPGALGDELYRLLQEIQLGASRRQALQRLRDRTEVDELSTFALALIQADIMGSPVAEVLQSNANQMRLIRRQDAREKAAQLPVKLLVPMLLFIFPALIVVIVGPAAISIIANFG
jgi:tight adherence protein C